MSHTWLKYPPKLVSRLMNLRNGGKFSEDKGMRLVSGRAGERREGNVVTIHLLVDPEDGVVADARFQAFGDTALVAAADIACDVVLRKNVAQAKRMNAEVIEQKIQPGVFPEETANHLNLVLAAIEEACEECSDLEVVDLQTPIAMDELGKLDDLDWESLSKEERIGVIAAVIEKDIQPYVSLDAGGVKVVDLKEGNEVIIAYEGTCTSCYSATGSTLSAIQQILRTKIDAGLVVTPDPSVLEFNPNY